MILNARTFPQKYTRSFPVWTYLQFQVRGAQTFYLAKDQGEAANQLDGSQLNTANTNPPFNSWWKGELWYSSNIDNSPLNVLILGEETPTFHP